jgi:hypothetical protein
MLDNSKVDQSNTMGTLRTASPPSSVCGVGKEPLSAHLGILLWPSRIYLIGKADRSAKAAHVRFKNFNFHPKTCMLVTSFQSENWPFQNVHGKVETNQSQS